MNSISFSLTAQHLIHSTKVTLLALVDGLQYERYFGEELSVQQPAAIPLFDTCPDSRIAFAGPWIIEMNSVMDFREKLCGLEAALPSVSWMVSSSTLTELVAHFRKYMNVELPDGRAALLRFQDPRVQVRLGATLDDLQHRDLTGLLQEWLTTVDGKVWSFRQRGFIC
ncbi:MULTISPECIES: DUF4123 domain-containing protein [Enterobacter]|uniref:DUF4123 domain-containing protein n=1 Tax=Enterobacter TaxID=547 RepID=UPI00067B1A7E|nr:MULTISPECIES: DUF4123 domain-containing protein [Enterobacter]EKK5414510.1 DUF4123 domain-containing protein [Enterobacter cloacae]KTI62774.1 hypothetical protein ASV00_23075 [Enterobacter cloacae subsp. cloacae]KVI63144.1 hypothetical protein AWS52_26225 [Enterobacter cloacae subsp. cloacae]MCK6845213.1 DUF4123 domain-containing protein [Enterobacter cloacae]MCM7453612.1 DUF4123 domain-containing protein [Enterobacter cloacae]